MEARTGKREALLKIAFVGTHSVGHDSVGDAAGWRWDEIGRDGTHFSLGAYKGWAFF